MPEGDPIPLVLDAATAKPIRTAGITRAGDYEVVYAGGYFDKVYDVDKVPQVVRLLRRTLAVYTADPSTRAGEDLELHYSAPRGASVSLRRAHGEVVYAMPSVPPATGQVPDEGLVSSGLEWPLAKVSVPPHAPTGIWMVELRSGDEVARAPFVLRCAASDSPRPVLVTASVATWLCYNDWGGRNRYRNWENGPPSLSSPLKRALSRALARLVPEIPRTWLKRRVSDVRQSDSWIFRPLSWRRPWGHYFDLQSAPDEPVLDHLVALDIKVLAWLDREGIDYECVADLDLDEDPSLCDGRGAVLLAGHSEYWSTAMLSQVLAAHRGKSTWVINLSGNTMYRRIHVHDDHSVNLADLVMALSGNDETELTGVRFSEKAYGTASPFAVTRATHWAFEGTGLARGDHFGEECLIANVPPSREDYDPTRPTTPDTMLNGTGAAGFEVDRLVWHRRREFTVIAEGVARSSAHMVVKEPKGVVGGAFSASSITFGGSLLVDDTCSRVVRNVLARAAQVR